MNSKYSKAYNKKVKKQMNNNQYDDGEYSDLDSSDDEEENNICFGYTQEYADQMNNSTLEQTKPKSGFDQIHRTTTRMSARTRKSTINSSRLSRHYSSRDSRHSSIRGIENTASREEVMEAIRKKLQREIDKKLTKRHLEVPTMALLSNEYGLPSMEIDNAEDLRNHIICHGCDTNLLLFVEELRRPSVRLETYHPLVIVDETIPSEWEVIILYQILK